jgi:hypothetical protein
MPSFMFVSNVKLPIQLEVVAEIHCPQAPSITPVPLGQPADGRSTHGISTIIVSLINLPTNGWWQIYSFENDLGIQKPVGEQRSPNSASEARRGFG